MPETTDESKRNRRTAKRILAIGLPLLLIAGTGIGYAFWTSTGGGSGSATSSAPIALALSGTAGNFAPGTSVTVPIMATNSNAYAVSISALTASATTPAELKCAGTGATDLSIAAPTLAGAAPFSVTPGPAVQVGSVVVTMSNAGYNQDLCKNFTLNLTFGAS